MIFMVEDNALQEVMDQAPDYHYRGSDGNNFKYWKCQAEMLIKRRRQRKIVELARKIDRPIKIYRRQIISHTYRIVFEVSLKDIKRVKLYNGDTGIVLFDTGVLSEGIDSYSDYIWATSTSIIPSTRYYVEVEDYHENIFMKGIPENDTPRGDLYDHDPALDIIGALPNINIPRRTYKTSIIETDYAKTEPPFHIDLSEQDYDYEQRIKQVMGYYGEIPLPSTEIYKYLGVIPSIVGRWRSVFYMGLDVMMDEDYLAAHPYDQDIRYMQDDEWNSAVFDIFVNLNNVPKNINVTDIESMQNIIDQTMPFAKKGYVNYIASEKYGESHTGLYDSYRIGPARIPVKIGLHESLKVTSHTIGGGVGLYDQLSIYGTSTQLYHDTDSDFAMDILSDVKISGTGSSAKVILTDFTVKNPTSVDPYYYGVSNPENMCDQDTDYAIYNYNYLYSYSFVNLVNCGFNIPNGSTITRIDVKFRRKADNANKFSNNQNIKLYYSGSERGNPFDPTNEYWPSDWETKTYTLTDFGYEWTPAKINDNTFGVHLGGVTNYRSTDRGYVQWVTITVCARKLDGTLITQRVTSDGYGWRTVETVQTIPSQCTLLYDVLNADTGSVISGYNNKTIPIDISGINKDTDIKIRAKLHTTDRNYTPELDSITVKARSKIF